MNCDWTMPVDFFASRTHYVDHIAPVYFALDADLRGIFYVTADADVANYAKSKGIEARACKMPEGTGPLVTCAYGDLEKAVKRNAHRPQLFMEHGVGQTFPHPAYAGGKGFKQYVSLFLDPNEIVRQKNLVSWGKKAGEIIGTPKLDRVFTTKAHEGGRQKAEGSKPVVCISFHWDGRAVCPEAGSAFEHYKRIVPVLSQCEDFTLIGHGHPRVADMMERFFQGQGIEFVRDFDEVMRRADLYVNDCSSTLYEFCTTGKPVVILNAPWFRKGVNLGIRFWRFSDVGPQVDGPGELVAAIREQLAVSSRQYAEAREKAVSELYPYLGQSAMRAAEVIQSFVVAKRPVMRRVDQVDGESIGIVYMGFGERAASEIQKSMASLRRLGLEMPVCVVGDTQVPGALFIPWAGENPFDAGQRENFQFRAGRVKPGLYELSPFERTLYIDADTEFMSDITQGFAMLSQYDMCLAEEILSIGQLYNKAKAGWEVNIQERDATIAELGGDPKRKFLNSGVIFFRKSDAVKAVFEEWGRQWRIWQQWDEQLALMRAMHVVAGSGDPSQAFRYKALSVDWNHPHRERAKIIFHNYGRGGARSNVVSPSPVLRTPSPAGRGEAQEA